MTGRGTFDKKGAGQQTRWRTTDSTNTARTIVTAKHKRPGAHQRHGVGFTGLWQLAVHSGNGPRHGVGVQDVDVVETAVAVATAEKHDQAAVHSHRVAGPGLRPLHVFTAAALRVLQPLPPGARDAVLFTLCRNQKKKEKKK